MTTPTFVPITAAPANLRLRPSICAAQIGVTSRAPLPHARRCSSRQESRLPTPSTSNSTSTSTTITATAASSSPAPSPSPASPSAAVPAPEPLILADGTVGGENRVGSFAIYDSSEALQYVGISRDVATSLRRVLFRRPQLAYYFTAAYLENSRPSRAALDKLRESVIAGREVPGLDGGREQNLWEEAVNVRTSEVTTKEEAEAMDNAELSDLGPILKKTVKRVQNVLEEPLKERGLKEKLKFEGKLKAKGLLDVGSVKIKVPDRIGSSTARAEDDE